MVTITYDPSLFFNGRDGVPEEAGAEVTRQNSLPPRNRASSEWTLLKYWTLGRIPKVRDRLFRDDNFVEDLFITYSEKAIQKLKRELSQGVVAEALKYWASEKELELVIAFYDVPDETGRKLYNTSVYDDGSTGLNIRLRINGKDSGIPIINVAPKWDGLQRVAGLNYNDVIMLREGQIVRRGPGYQIVRRDISGVVCGINYDDISLRLSDYSVAHLNRKTILPRGS